MSAPQTGGRARVPTDASYCRSCVSLLDGAVTGARQALGTMVVDSLHNDARTKTVHWD